MNNLCSLEGCNNPLPRKDNKFCSKYCAKIGQKRNTGIKYYEKICLRAECEKPFRTAKSDPKKYCSKSCATIVNNTGINKRTGKTANIALECCNIYCKQRRKYNTGNYCSNSCRTEQITLEKSFESQKLGYPVVNNQKSIKDFILFIRGAKCEIRECSIENWLNKPVPLVLDHINGDSSDNSITNLRLVCGNCDMQLPTYKSKNKGNGRHSRRQRYKENKSY